MNSILFTGSRGFLGRVLESQLSEKSYKVYDLQYEKNKRIDISTEFLISVPYAVDTIIHAAGKAHSIPRTQNEKQLFYDINYQGTVNLTKAIDALPQKPKSFIFISTVSVYGLDKGKSINETAPLKGDSPYAKSKIMAEDYLTKWAKENNIILGILRLPLIAGPNPPGNLGAMINGIKTGKYLSIGEANAKKSIVLAEDVANIIPKLIEVGGIYNLTDGYHPSFGELENAISSSIGKSNPMKIPIWLAKLIGKAGDLLGANAPINSNKLAKITSTLTFDDSKARKNLGWKPSRVLDKIKEII